MDGDAQFHLALAFDTDDPEFRRGVEVGIIWQRLEHEQSFGGVMDSPSFSHPVEWLTHPPGGIEWLSVEAQAGQPDPAARTCYTATQPLTAAQREAAAEVTRLGEELGTDDISEDEVVALCREARRELAAEREREG